MINGKDARVIEPGWFTIAVGGRQPGSSGLAGQNEGVVITSRCRLTGREIKVKD
jgi:beta-glucosidase